MNKSNLLIFGATGMLGSTMVKYFSEIKTFNVFSTFRSEYRYQLQLPHDDFHIINGIDASNPEHIENAFKVASPDIVINCIGIVKQLPEANDHLLSISLNSLLPHKLAYFCSLYNARLIHISTDCVFSGAKGNYIESDIPDASDLYGRSKLLGEVDYSNAITLRTSIIGHELSTSQSLINWFLSQKEKVRGFTNAIFSGLPTITVAKVIESYVLPYPNLSGLYHLSVDPINKYDLLSIVKEVYKKKIEIEPDSSLVIDRSLDSSRFRGATGFSPKPWPELIRAMYNFG